MMEVVGNVVLIVVVCGAAVVGGLIGNIMGWRSGRKLGQREGFIKYTRQLRFERRPYEPDLPLIDPTDQPHSRRPRGRARVTDAHMSQPRADWSA